MPPRQVKPKDTMKADVSEKVREIKLRQQKWLKERDESIKNKPSEAKGHKENVAVKGGHVTRDMSSVNPSATKQTRDLQTRVHKKTRTESTPVTNLRSATSNHDIPNKQAQFHVWLSNKKPKESHKASPDSHDSGHFSTDQDGGDRQPVSPLELDSDMPPTPVKYYNNGKEMRKQQQNYQPSHYSDMESYSETSRPPRQIKKQEEDTSRALSPTQFDVLADRIVSRVKQELVLSHHGSGDEQIEASSRGTATGHQAIRGDERSPSRPKAAAAATQSGGPLLDSHVCAGCYCLMVPPNNDAMLVIPCGHTTCRGCAAVGDVCPTCETDITSVTPNIMLQQIISDYQKRNTADGDRPSHSKSRPARGHSATRKLGQTYSQIPRDKHGKSAHQYDEELHNLEMRCEVLQQERMELGEKVQETEQQQQQQHGQIQNICREQTRARKQMEKLQAAVDDLERHKQQFEDKAQDLERTKDEQQQKITMVTQTLKQHKRDIDKVRKMKEELSQ